MTTGDSDMIADGSRGPFVVSTLWLSGLGTANFHQLTKRKSTLWGNFIVRNALPTALVSKRTADQRDKRDDF
jgi:hypothetical protein